MTPVEIRQSIATVKCTFRHRKSVAKKPCGVCIKNTGIRIKRNSDITYALIEDTAVIIANNYGDYDPGFLELDFALKLLEHIIPVLKERLDK